MKPHSRKNEGIYEIDQVAAMSATLESLTKKVDNFVKVAYIQSPEYQCEFYEGNHATENCNNNLVCVNFVGNQNRTQNNPYSNIYNAGWKNHPNFSWGGSNNGSRCNTWKRHMRH